MKDDRGSREVLTERSTNVGRESTYLSFNYAGSIVVHVDIVTPKKNLNESAINLTGERTNRVRYREGGLYLWQAQVQSYEGTEWGEGVKKANENALKTQERMSESG